MVSQCSFDLNFSNDQWWWASFYMFVDLMYVFFWKVSVISFAHFWTGLFFSCKSVLVLCRFWILALCQMGRLEKFFSHSVGCRFTLMIVSFAMQKLWSLIRSRLSILAFVANAFGVLVINSLPMPMSWMVLPRFSSRVFMVLGLMFVFNPSGVCL